MASIRAVLFDLGGVILSSPFEAFSRFERDRGLPDGFLRTVNATNPDTNAWARLERSEIDLAAFGDAFADESASLGHRIDGREVLALLLGDLRPAMVEALRRCHQRPGLSTALVTNNFVIPAGALDRDQPRQELMDLFDVVVESSQLGLRKPDPRVYELVCQRLGVMPAEAVFLDDLGVNLKPARAMGMTTIKVVDPDEALAELESILGFALG